MSYATNSSTAIKPRQQQRSEFDITFAKLVNRIRSTGELPTEAERRETGQWIDSLLQLVEAWQIDGEPGFADTLKALSKNNPRMAALLATFTEQDQAESRYFITDDQGKKQLKLYSIADIYETPDAQYLISAILEEAASSVLYGVSGTGKTFTALNAALCVAHGIALYRRHVRQGIAWYINTEGARGLKKRIKAWYLEHEDLTLSENFKVIPWSMDLREHFLDLLYTIQQQQEKPALIVIDNFSMCTPGINQNLQEEVAPILRQINGLAQDYGCHIMMVHHTNKVGDFNGTMAFRNHVDTMIELRKEDPSAKDSAIIFSCQKTRDDEPFSDIKTELKQVQLGLDVIHEPITSCVVVESETPIKAEGLKDTVQNILDILGDETLLYSAWEKEATKRLNIAKVTFDRARLTLTSKGYVRKVKVKVEGKELDHYCRVAVQKDTSTESEQDNEE